MMDRTGGLQMRMDRDSGMPWFDKKSGDFR